MYICSSSNIAEISPVWIQDRYFISDCCVVGCVNKQAFGFWILLISGNVSVVKLMLMLLLLLLVLVFKLVLMLVLMIESRLVLASTCYNNVVGKLVSRHFHFVTAADV